MKMPVSEMKKFYRVCKEDTFQGLWYAFDGSFTGLIHDKFNFCLNTELKMDFDHTLVGWLSATDDLNTLYQWFTEEDIRKLQEHGWYIYEVHTDEYKWYDKFQHWIVKQDACRVGDRIIL